MANKFRFKWHVCTEAWEKEQNTVQRSNFFSFADNWTAKKRRQTYQIYQSIVLKFIFGRN